MILFKFSTIVLGIKSLFVQFKYSLPLILLNILPYLIYRISYETYNSISLADSDVFMLVAFNFLPSLLIAFINLTLFIAAGMILIKESFYKNYLTSALN